jgi:hypothetical protein
MVMIPPFGSVLTGRGVVELGCVHSDLETRNEAL